MDLSWLDPRMIFGIVGPVFLVLGVLRSVQARRLVPQARAWLLTGTIFSAVALWLWLGRP